MADPVKTLDIWEVLDKVIEGGKLKAPEKDAVVASTAAMRQEFLGDIGVALQQELTPGTPDFQRFKDVMRSMAELFIKHGIISVDEASGIWMAIESREKGR